MRLLERPITAVKFLASHLRDPQSKTYYPEEERKSRIEVCLDNFRWMFRHFEINHFYYLYGLDRKYGVNQDDYLPKRVFDKLLTKANGPALVGGRQASYVYLLQDKFVFGKYLESLGFPTPKIIALCERDSIIWFDTQRTMPLGSMLEREGLDVFIKELLGMCAEGVYPVRVKDGKLYFNEKQITIESLRMVLKNKCIVQERVNQHSKIKQLYPDSVNTIRLATVINNGEVVPLSAVIRTGVNGLRCDNWTAGGIAIGIDLATGRLRKYGIFKPGYGGKLERHPDTGLKFEDFEIPYFDRVVQMALSLHRFFYGVHSIAWDIGITESGPTFIEGNNRWGMATLQTCNREFKEKFLSTHNF
jgi:hypothetical protein